MSAESGKRARSEVRSRLTVDCRNADTTRLNATELILLKANRVRPYVVEVNGATAAILRKMKKRVKPDTSAPPKRALEAGS